MSDNDNIPESPGSPSEFDGIFDRFDNADVFDAFRRETERSAKREEAARQRAHDEAVRKEAAELAEELRLKAEQEAALEAAEDEEYEEANRATGAKLRGKASGRIPDTWVTSDDLEKLNEESRQIKEGETDEELTRRILRANLPAVAMGLSKMALYDPNSNVRLRASQYLMDRVLGKPGEDVNAGTQSPVEKLISEITEVLNR